MASKDEKPQKKQSLFKQIAQIYKFTVADDKKLPWLLAGAWLAPVVLFVILGLVFHWTWLTWIFVMVMAIMVGALFATMTLTNRADKVGYTHLEGKPGAAVSVLSNISKAGFNFPEQPVWFDGTYDFCLTMVLRRSLSLTCLSPVPTQMRYTGIWEPAVTPLMACS